MKLSDRYLLTSVSHKAPKARKTSVRGREAMAKDARNSGASFMDSRELGGAYVELYSPGSIKSVMTHFHAFNTYHQAVTCEYIGGRGAPRLLSVHKQTDHSDKFHEAVLAWQQAKQQWIAEYAEEREKARQRLGDYFEEADYPSPEAIADYWQFRCTYMPIADPTAFELGAFSEEQREILEKQLHAASERAAREATNEYRKRLKKALSHLSHQMRHGKRLHQSLLDNVLNLADSNLNVAGDPDLDAVAETIRQHEALKNYGNAAIANPKEQAVRDHTAAMAEQINRKLAGLSR